MTIKEVMERYDKLCQKKIHNKEAVFYDNLKQPKRRNYD